MQIYSSVNRFKMIKSQPLIWGVITTEIKTEEMHLEHQIKIKRRRLDMLLLTRATWLHLDGTSEIQRSRLNRNNSHSCISSEPLIEDQILDQTVTPNSPYKYRCSSTV